MKYVESQGPHGKVTALKYRLVTVKTQNKSVHFLFWGPRDSETVGEGPWVPNARSERMRATSGKSSRMETPYVTQREGTRA